MIQNIEDLTEPPTVGKFYMVPCVEVRERHDLMTPTGWLPVTGPKHEDKEHIKFPWQHWHYDIRFLSEQQLSGTWLSADRIFGHVIKTTIIVAGEVRPIPCISEKTTLCRLKCRREMPAYPHHLAERSFGPELRAAYATKRVICGKCPHKGVPLSSLPREPGTNVVTCPGHGLRWDLTTGSLVR